MECSKAGGVAGGNKQSNYPEIINHKKRPAGTGNNNSVQALLLGAFVVW